MQPWRIKRHDNILNWLVGRLEDQGHQVLKEPRISTAQGLWKPNIVVWFGTNSYVLDLQICRDSNIATLEEHDRRKIQKYDTPDVRRKVLELTGLSAEVAAITINWRGVPSKQAVWVLKKLGVKNTHISLFILKVMEGSLSIYANYMGMAGGGDMT